MSEGPNAGVEKGAENWRPDALAHPFRYSPETKLPQKSRVSSKDEVAPTNTGTVGSGVGDRHYRPNNSLTDSQPET